MTRSVGSFFPDAFHRDLKNVTECFSSHDSVRWRSKTLVVPTQETIQPRYSRLEKSVGVGGRQRARLELQLAARLPRVSFSPRYVSKVSQPFFFFHQALRDDVDALRTALSESGFHKGRVQILVGVLRRAPGEDCPQSVFLNDT